MYCTEIFFIFFTIIDKKIDAFVTSGHINTKLGKVEIVDS